MPSTSSSEWTHEGFCQPRPSTPSTWKSPHQHRRAAQKSHALDGETIVTFQKIPPTPAAAAQAALLRRQPRVHRLDNQPRQYRHPRHTFTYVSPSKSSRSSSSTRQTSIRQTRSATTRGRSSGNTFSTSQASPASAEGPASATRCSWKRSSHCPASSSATRTGTRFERSSTHSRDPTSPASKPTSATPALTRSTSRQRRSR